jgi:hypothetical protein
MLESESIIIHVKNQGQKALIEKALRGQLSDDYWKF